MSRVLPRPLLGRLDTVDRTAVAETDDVPMDAAIDVFDALERHGYHRGDDAHLGRAVHLLGALVAVYTGESAERDEQAEQAGAEDTAVGIIAAAAYRRGALRSPLRGDELLVRLAAARSALEAFGRFDVRTGGVYDALTAGARVAYALDSVLSVLPPE